MEATQRTEPVNLALASEYTSCEKKKNSAFDLLNNRNERFIREGSDRRVYVRGETEILENGKVRVRPIATRACWSFEGLQQELQEGLKHRKTATSTVHSHISPPGNPTPSLILSRGSFEGSGALHVLHSMPRHPRLARNDLNSCSILTFSTSSVQTCLDIKYITQVLLFVYI
jgi:hypothetical protein